MRIYLNQIAIINYMKEFMNMYQATEEKSLLEIGGGVDRSLSVLLKAEYFPSFLLSNSVTYKELKEAGIIGAKGIIRRGGLCLEQDPECEKFFKSIRLSNFKNEKPAIADFSAMIASGYNKDLENALSSSLPKYFGVCCDHTIEDDFISGSPAYLDYILARIASDTSTEYTISHDTINDGDQELFLLHPKNR